MRSTRQLSITLPEKMADAVRQKVASGAYASESEVIREGLRALEDREQAVEHWLRSEVVEIYDAVMADPSKLRSTEQVRQSIARVREELVRAKAG